MDITITPHTLKGEINIIPSKSQAHRLLICAAFADKPTELICRETNRDIDATADCLRALGANIVRSEIGYTVYPTSEIPETAQLNCCESGSTLRFMLPIVGALGVNGTFLMEGRLGRRPLSPLWEEMEKMGCSLAYIDKNTLHCTGKLRAGHYSIDGGVSSQFITGLLLALNLLDQESTLNITGKIESKPYISLTENSLKLFRIDTMKIGGQKFCSPGIVDVEGDWSNGAFFMAAEQLGSSLCINGLSSNTVQGDYAVVDILNKLDRGCINVDGADIPDLVPILAVYSACRNGAVFTNIARLRLKESDRVATVCAMLGALGVQTRADENELIVFPGPITGGTVNACNDHRIAMSAAIAATVASGPVTIQGAECVNKSYPKFWEEYKRLGGSYEQYLR